MTTALHLQLGKEYAKIQKDKATLAEKEAKIKEQIEAIMHELEETSMEFGSVKATIVTPKPAKRFNQQEFKEAHPTLFKKFTKEGKAARPHMRLSKVNGGW